MPNPVKYQDLFDIDGLRAAIIETEAATDAYGKAAQADFDLIGKSVDVLKGKLLDVGAILNKPIKLTDDAGQQQVIDLSKQVADLTVQIKQQQIAIDAFNATMVAQKQVIQDAKVAEAEYSAQLKKSKLDEQDVKVAIAEHTLALKQLALANKQNGTDTNTLISPYKQLSQQLTATRNSAKDMVAQLVLSGSSLKEALGDENVRVAVKNVTDLDKTVKGIDGTFGQSQRNVGNYASSFGKAFGVIRQAAYILPGIGIAGILNLIGEAVVSLVSKLEIFNPLLTATEEKFSALTRAVSDKSYTEAIENIDKLTINIKLARDGFIDQNLVVDQYNATLGKTAGAVDTLDEAEQKLTKHGTDYITITRLKAAAELSLADAAKATYETAQKNFAIQERSADLASGKKTLSTFLQFVTSSDPNKSDASLIAENQKAIDKNNDQLKKDVTNKTNIAKNFYDQIADISKKSGFSNGLTPDGDGVSAEATLQANLALKLIDIDKDTQQKILDNNKASYKERLAASTKYEQDTIQAAKVSQELQLTQTGLSGNQIALIHLTTQNQITEAQNAGIKQRQDLRDKASDQDLQHLKNSLQAQKDAAKLVLDNPDATVDQKQSALDSSNAASKGIIGATYDAQVKQAGAVTEALKLAKDDRNKALLQLDIDYQNESNKILEDGYNKQIKAAREHDKQVIALINQEVSDEKDALSKRVDAINQSRADEVNALSIQYGKGLLTEQQYNNQVKLIDDKFNAEKLQEELKTAEQIVAIRALVANNSPEQQKAYDAAKKNVADITLALTNLNIKTNTDKAVANVEKLKQAVDALNKSAQTVGSATGNAGLGSLFGDLSTDLVNGIGKADEFQKTAQLGMDAVGAYTDFAINSSKARIKALQDEADHDVGLAGDNAEAKARIQDAYNKKIAEEQNKQARLQKAAAVVDIAINTAVAISKTLATTAIFGIPLIPIIAALGALEIGLVLAQPTPQYATGRNGGPEEVAEINERGPELIGQKGKYRFANRGMRGFVKLNAGDEVKTATDTKMMLANGMITADGQYVTNVSQSKTIYDNYIMAANQQSGIDYNRMQDAVAGGVSGLPVSEHHWNENGYQQNTRIKNTRIMDVNRRNRF